MEDNRRLFSVFYTVINFSYPDADPLEIHRFFLAESREKLENYLIREEEQEQKRCPEWFGLTPTIIESSLKSLEEGISEIQLNGESGRKKI